MIPLERASQDLGRSTILIMKIQKGGPQIKIIWGEIIPPIFPEEDGQIAVCGVWRADENFSLLLRAD